MILVQRSLDRPLPEFKGRRAFIVGSGPSLDSLDLSLLDGQLVLALNAAATLLPQAWWIFRDRRAVGEIVPRITPRKVLRVITTSRALGELQSRLRGFHAVHALVYDEKRIVHERTVAEDAIQLARIAGCSDAVLVGVDCHAPPGRPYAASLDWKPCAWYDRKDPVPESKACASFLKALRSLAASGKLGDFPVFSSSSTCDAFPFLPYAEAVAACSSST